MVWRWVLAHVRGHTKLTESILGQSSLFKKTAVQYNLANHTKKVCIFCME